MIESIRVLFIRRRLMKYIGCSLSVGFSVTIGLEGISQPTLLAAVEGELYPSVLLKVFH